MLLVKCSQCKQKKKIAVPLEGGLQLLRIYAIMFSLTASCLENALLLTHTHPHTTRMVLPVSASKRRKTKRRGVTRKLQPFHPQSILSNLPNFSIPYTLTLTTLTMINLKQNNGEYSFLMITRSSELGRYIFLCVFNQDRTLFIFDPLHLEYCKTDDNLYDNIKFRIRI